jgi:hypothetical protein
MLGAVAGTVDKLYRPLASAGRTLVDELVEHAEHGRDTHSGAKQYNGVSARGLQRELPARRHSAQYCASCHMLVEIVGGDARWQTWHRRWFSFDG